MHILKFSYLRYNILLAVKFLEVIMKEFVKFVLLSRDYQKKRFFWEKLGRINNLPEETASGRWIWVYANAIGEVNACQPLFALIKSKYPGIKIFLTTANFSADKRAFQLNLADRISFFPYDYPWIIKKILNIFKPACVLIIECDVWPNLVKICKERGIATFVISGTYSDKNNRSLGLRYLYNYTFRLSGDVFKYIDYFCMQTEKDASGLRSVIPEHKNINVSGNLKFSGLGNSRTLEEKGRYRKIFNIKETTPVFIAGNIHIEELSLILDAFISIKKDLASSRLILAPRFIEAVIDMERKIKERGFVLAKKTDFDNHNNVGHADMILVDTMGELGEIYSLASVAFVGGSLVYLNGRFGGHNILEPAALGVPVLFGPYMHNFQALADLFLERRAAIEVKDSKELADAVIRLISYPEDSKSVVLSAQEIFNENKDVTERAFIFIDGILKQASYN